jgi:formate-dependent nitrite reductase membrane component NrfD
MNLEYLNTVSNQLILISSLMSGFSIAILANLLIDKTDSKIATYVFRFTSVAAGCFLVTVFALTKIIKMTTKGYQYEVTAEDFVFTSGLASTAFIIGIFTLCIVIALTGWIKSKKTGIFTTIVGFLTLLFTVLTMLNI